MKIRGNKQKADASVRDVNKIPDVTNRSHPSAVVAAIIWGGVNILFINNEKFTKHTDR